MVHFGADTRKQEWEDKLEEEGRQLWQPVWGCMVTGPYVPWDHLRCSQNLLEASAWRDSNLVWGQLLLCIHQTIHSDSETMSKLPQKAPAKLVQGTGEPKTTTAPTRFPTPSRTPLSPHCQLWVLPKAVSLTQSLCDSKRSSKPSGAFEAPHDNTPWHWSISTSGCSSFNQTWLLLLNQSPSLFSCLPCKAFVLSSWSSLFQKHSWSSVPIHTSIATLSSTA